MPEIKLQQKVIDPATGSEHIEKRVFNISESDPYNSIEFHRVCDVLDVKRFDRLDHHVSVKVAVIYNYLAHILKTNDVSEIEKAVDRFKKSTEAGNTTGPELVSRMYKVIRLDMDAKGIEERKQMVQESANRLSDELVKDSDRAEELRKSGEKTRKTKEKTEKESKQRTDKRVKDLQKEAKSMVDSSKVPDATAELQPAQEL